MATSDGNSLTVPRERYGISRASSLGRDDKTRRRSGSPAVSSRCTYSRVSAIKENSIFKKYLEVDKSIASENKASDQTTEGGKSESKNTDADEHGHHHAPPKIVEKIRPSSAGPRIPRRTLVTSVKGVAERVKEECNSALSSDTSRDKSRNAESRDSRKHDSRKECYQTIRQSLEQFAKKDTPVEKSVQPQSAQRLARKTVPADESVLPGGETVPLRNIRSETGHRPVRSSSTSRIPLFSSRDRLSQPKRESSLRVSRTSDCGDESETERRASRQIRPNQHLTGDSKQETVIRQRTSLSLRRDHTRDSSRAVTPSFEEFKKRMRIPSFDEFRKRRDSNEDDKESRLARAVGKIARNKDIASESRKSKGVTEQPPTAKTDRPASATVTSSDNVRSSLPNKDKTHSPVIKTGYADRLKLSSVITPLDQIDAPIKDGEVFVSKGIRIKPSYISDADSSDDEDLVPVSPRDEDLDNSLDDNILIATESEKESATRGEKCDAMPGLNYVENANCVKRMDSEGNFWIVVKDENSEEIEECTLPLKNPDVCPHADRSTVNSNSRPPLPRPSPCSTERGNSETTANVLRSTSDVSDLATSAGRKRKDRRERPHKSDPFSRTERMRHRQLSREGSLFQGFSCSSIEEVSSCGSALSLDELPDETDESDSVFARTRLRSSSLSTCSADSGVVGNDFRSDRKPNEKTEKTEKVSECHGEQRRLSAGDVTRDDSAPETATACKDCGKNMDSSEISPSSATCRRCDRRRLERFRTLQEIVDTEATYRRDLKILKEEFYLPIKSAGLLSSDQLNQVFLNVDELLQVNYEFLQQLKPLLRQADVKDGDEITAKTGELFLRASSQFMAFKTYCINQAQAAAFLEQFERENELLKIFLQVSQTENTNLRKMNLKSFHVIPIQRITKYPLLLNRLHKSTPVSHKGREQIKSAIQRIEDILDYINGKTNSLGPGSMKSRRRRPDSRSSSILERFELIKIAQEQVNWEKAEVSDALVSKLQMAQPADHTWAVKKGKTLKFSTIYAVALTQGKPTRINECRDKLWFSRPTTVKQVVLVLLKEKNEEYQPIREPLPLHQCVVTVDPDYPEAFEVQEWNKESYVFKADKTEETQHWAQHLKQRAIDLSLWRRRRNGLANIMIKQSC